MAEAEPNLPDALEISVDQAIAICDGDARVALKAALVANSFLESEVQRLTHAVSVGFMRGKLAPSRQAAEKLEEWREIAARARRRAIRPASNAIPCRQMPVGIYPVSAPR